MTGQIISIFVGPDAGKPLDSVATARLEAGRGLVGDRYYRGTGTFSEKLQGTPDVELTLIEVEEIEAFNGLTGKQLTAADFRRNLVTRGVRLNDLIDKEFRVGEVRLKGIRLCEPCAHLARTLGQGIMDHMVHKSGLRAQILNDGTVSSDDLIAIE